MDVKTKQKPKKRRTRKNLDDLRKRSHREVKKNGNQISENKFKNIPKYNNELITCKRLTLSLFKKAIRSKTVTRLPFTRIDNTNNVNGKTMSNILTMSPQYQNPIDDVSIIWQNNIALESPTVNKLFKKHACEIIVHGKNDPTSTSPSKNGFMNTEDSPEEGNYKCEYLNNFTSDSNSEVESIHCYYEKFMNELPAYLEEHFPALTSNFLNKNLACLKQNYLENSQQEKEINIDFNYPTVNTPQNHRGLIIQNPMDYIQIGLSWEQSVKTKQSISLLNSCSPSLPASETSSSGIFLNSPDYQYFPHKLNQ